MEGGRLQRIRVIDSHTGGEPTRVVIEGGPELGEGPLADRLARFRGGFDRYRAAIVNEPRGSDVIVGALLCTPVNPAAAAGVLFFNNVGYLGMCGHGAIGVVATLRHLGQIEPGTHLLETPVGTVTAQLEAGGAVRIENVPSYRYRRRVPLSLPGGLTVHGDVAWGGNWFFLVEDHGQDLDAGRVDALTEFTWAVRQQLTACGITGAGGAEIDHIELFGPAGRADARSRNFVLCPGKAYDRSPCGTGTSAKVACLAADGKLREGEVWRQESITGSLFEAQFRMLDGQVIPTIRGSAWISAEATLLIDPEDPFAWGIPR